MIETIIRRFIGYDFCNMAEDGRISFVTIIVSGISSKSCPSMICRILIVECWYDFNIRLFLIVWNDGCDLPTALVNEKYVFCWCRIKKKHCRWLCKKYRWLMRLVESGNSFWTSFGRLVWCVEKLYGGFCIVCKKAIYTLKRVGWVLREFFECFFSCSM